MKNRYRLILVTMLSLILMGGQLLLPGETASASSGIIAFSTDTPSPKTGDNFTVVCAVTCTDSFLDTDFYVSYDNTVMKFVDGGNKVSGSKGLLHIKSTGNKTAKTKRTFALKFTAKKAGAAAVAVSDTASITDANGTVLSVSSNRLSISVDAAGADGTSPDASVAVGTTPAPENALSNNNRLSSLEINAVSVSPEFDPKVYEYNATVDCNTQTLFYSANCANKKANLTVSGNESLQPGKNEAIFIVTAESGKQKQYKVTITKETEEETKARLANESAAANGNTGITFQVTNNAGIITLKNSYEFEVLDVVNETTIPSGFIKSKIQIDGVEIPAYTMEKDLDNNYLLLYLKGPSGEAYVYQYDRDEKTIQRYTGDMIEKINKDGKDGYVTESGSSNNTVTVLFIVIVTLVVMVLILFASMLKMMAKKKRKEEPHRTKEDEFEDFLR